MSIKKNEVVKINVVRLLMNLSVGHEFGTGTGDIRATSNNCVRTLTKSYRLVDRRHQEVDVPEGSEVVIYRNPRSAYINRYRLACVHLPKRDRQVVVYSDGLMYNQNLEDRTTLGSILGGSTPISDYAF